MTRNLAVTYRPHRLRDVVGQADVIATLTSAVARRTVPAQILLYGASGLGKTTIARALAAAMLCESPVGGDGCGHCTTCLAVADGSHPDVVEIDAASHGGIDQIRQIGASAQLAPLLGEWRITIIDEAHGISGPGIQAFLKVLEEPPSHNVFVLATTEPERLGATIRGRCLALHVTTPSGDDLARNLVRVAGAEGVTLSPTAAREMVGQSDGELGVRGTVGVLERVLQRHPDVDTISEENVGGLLGDERALLTGLTGAIEGHDRRGALLALRAVRDTYDDGTLRAYLVSWGQRRLDAQVDTGGDLRAVLDALERCLVTPKGAGWLDILVATLAEPGLTNLSVELSDLIAEAREVGDALSSMIAAAGTFGDSLTAEELAADEPGVSVMDEHGTVGAAAVHGDAAVTTQRSEAGAGGSPGDGGAVVDAALILNAVAARDARVALRVRRAGLVVDGGTRTVRITGPLDDSDLAVVADVVAGLGASLAGRFG